MLKYDFGRVCTFELRFRTIRRYAEIENRIRIFIQFQDIHSRQYLFETCYCKISEAILVYGVEYSVVSGVPKICIHI